ncbi:MULTISPECIES: ABC transporter substrate-binding protein [Phyllobacteriaceae]|jgi:branched-chain amino acid transport system substrate-binding protein|uniref:Branched-chain amino acid ABC transporter substrate-binding protein n=1 Tax=Mesorhizobium hungaricum TaxID=1566387 RepID=A0A1C2DVU6_9HYPH|nr:MULTISPECIES: ABC transporter substrate-binding protein [Mesorhizobium]MBN9233927.1 ABC transporter substrate-binding protein [Mesorhizobium sp.]MDQ0331458.1 branched-chain amino acid transport system substrate-binding protein [Mesorhizobium sp. YL-MeA3-2017]OCX18900.1 branched-chain amino acid ABC transporter substrate-binding protein [Mesorhizobium hungaricum]
MKEALISLVAVGTLATATIASAEEVKIGVELGFTGPLESIVPSMEKSAQMAVVEANNSKTFLAGTPVKIVTGDSTCIDSAAAIAAAQRLITSERVAAIVGPDCSGVTGAVLQSVARPNGIVMISPDATSPALTTAPDDGLFFRTAPSDARQGEVMASVILKRGVKSVALTYTNNDYGKGLADSFKAAYEKAGGKVTITVPHEDSKADYSAEVGTLASAGGDMLVVAGYVDKGGKGVIQGALDAGAFDKFYLPDGMYGDSLLKAIGKPMNGSFGDVPGIDSPGHAKFLEMTKAAGFDGTSSYTGETYDAMALILLAMQAAKSPKSADFKDKVMSVANGPGEKIYPGEIAKGLKLLSEGKPIDYEGATGVKLVEPGESAGSYRVYSIKDGKQVTDYYAQ